MSVSYIRREYAWRTKKLLFLTWKFKKGIYVHFFFAQASTGWQWNWEDLVTQKGVDVLRMSLRKVRTSVAGTHATQAAASHIVAPVVLAPVGISRTPPDALTACLDANGTYICTAYNSRCLIIQKVSVLNYPFVLPYVALTYSQNGLFCAKCDSLLYKKLHEYLPTGCHRCIGSEITAKNHSQCQIVAPVDISGHSRHIGSIKYHSLSLSIPFD